jgi:hypothetical protein
VNYDDDYPLYEAVSGLGSASTLNTTRPEGETAPPNNPIGFIWPEKDSQ